MNQLKYVNAVDYVIIVGYMVLVISTSIYLARYIKRTDDYFKAGGKMPWFIAGISNFMSGFSAFMFVAAAGFTYKYGLPALVIFTSAFWAYWLGYFIYGKLWRRARLSSPMEYLTRRFSPSTTYYYSVISIVPQIIGLGMAIYILCIFVSTALGLNAMTFNLFGVEIAGFQVAILIIGLVIIFDTIFGGLWAAVVSDMIKFLIIFLMALIVFPVAFIYLGGDGGFIGGVQKLLYNSPEGYFKFHTEFQTPFFFVAYIVQVLMGYNIAWQLGQRYYSVPDERDTKKMAMLSAILSLVGPLLWIIPAMASRQIFPNIRELWPQIADPTEASFVSLAMLVLPHGMIGVVVAAILAATIGTSNDAFGWLAAVFAKDIFVPIKRRITGHPPSDRAQLITGKMTILTVGLISIAVALYVPRFGGAFQFALDVNSFYGPALSAPVMLGFVYRKTPWWSAIAASLSGIVLVAIVNILVPLGTHKFEVNTLVGVGTVCVVLFISRFFPNRRQEDQARLEAFLRDLATPAYAEHRVFDPSGFAVYGLIGRLALVIGCVLVLMGFFADASSQGQIINLIAGLLMLLTGGSLVYFLQYRKR